MKKRKIIIGITSIVVILLFVCIFWIINNQSKNNLKEQENNIQEEQPQQEYNLMDMENQNNVKIENNVKENTSQELLKERTVLGMRLFNIKLIGEGSLTTFTADVENISENDFVGRTITIVFENEDGSENAKLEAVLPDIPKGQSSKIDASITTDITNSYNIRIETEK